MFMLLKNNWKKVAVLTPISAYGFYSLSSHMEETAHMRKLCNEILAKEDIHVSPRKLLVVINPAANKKKTEKLFKKYCEPILHLGGYSVTIMKTNYVGHAKSYIENLSHLPDAIVVAGGQGTSSEVVTGLLRRTETPCPLLILPLGRTQKEEQSANSLIGNSNYVKLLSKCALSLIQYKTHFEPVIRYDAIDDEKKSKPTYGLNKFSWGLVRDISVKKDNYWYFGSLRKYAVILFNAFSNNLNLAFGTNYAYTPPCQGCNNCVMVNVTNKNSSFMQRLVTSNKKDNNSKLNIMNESCSQRIQGFVETCQVDIACKKNSENFYELETEFKEIMSRGIELLQHSKNIVNGTMDKSLAIRSRTLELYPCDNKENNSYFGIDGEEFSARAIKVSLIQNAIRVFD